MSHSQFHSTKEFILTHAWLNLWDKHMTTGRINQVTILCRTYPTDGSTSPRNGIGRPRSLPPRGGGAVAHNFQGSSPWVPAGTRKLTQGKVHSQLAQPVWGVRPKSSPRRGNPGLISHSCLCEKVNAQSKSHRPTREFRPCELPPKRQHRAHVPGPVWHLDSLPKEGNEVQSSSPITASATHSLHSPTAPPTDGGRPSQGAEGRSTTWGNSSPARRNSAGPKREPPGFPQSRGMLPTFPYSHKPPPTHSAGHLACTPPLTLPMVAHAGSGLCTPHVCESGPPAPPKIPQLTIPRSVLGSPFPAANSSREGDRSGRALFDWGESGGSRIGAPPGVVPGPLRPRDRVWSRYFGPPCGTPQSSPGETERGTAREAAERGGVSGSGRKALATPSPRDCRRPPSLSPARCELPLPRLRDCPHCLPLTLATPSLSPSCESPQRDSPQTLPGGEGERECPRSGRRGMGSGWGVAERRTRLPLPPPPASRPPSLPPSPCARDSLSVLKAISPPPPPSLLQISLAPSLPSPPPFPGNSLPSPAPFPLPSATSLAPCPCPACLGPSPETLHLVAPPSPLHLVAASPPLPPLPLFPLTSLWSVPILSPVLPNTLSSMTLPPFPSPCSPSTAPPPLAPSNCLSASLVALRATLLPRSCVLHTSHPWSCARFCFPPLRHCLSLSLNLRKDRAFTDAKRTNTQYQTSQ